MNDRSSRTTFLAIGALAAILDLVTKWWVFEAIPEGRDHAVLGDLLSFRPTRNPAGPWSWGHGVGLLRFALPLLSVVAVVVIWRVWRTTDPADRVKNLGLVLILGGAVGNLWDRAATLVDRSHGGVRDFLIVKGVWFRAEGASWKFWNWNWGMEFPAFNLADTWITVGVVLVAWRILFEARTDGAAEPAGEQAPADGVRA